VVTSRAACLVEPGFLVAQTGAVTRAAKRVAFGQGDDGGGVGGAGGRLGDGVTGWKKDHDSGVARSGVTEVWRLGEASRVQEARRGGIGRVRCGEV
jgi:hypothetical protein